MHDGPFRRTCARSSAAGHRGAVADRRVARKEPGSPREVNDLQLALIHPPGNGDQQKRSATLGSRSVIDQGKSLKNRSLWLAQELTRWFDSSIQDRWPCSLPISLPIPSKIASQCIARRLVHWRLSMRRNWRTAIENEEHIAVDRNASQRLTCVSQGRLPGLLTEAL